MVLKRENKMKSIQYIVLGGALLALLTPSLGAAPVAAPVEGAAIALDEQFQYRWQLKNFVGALAGLFLPNQGDGSLTFRTTNGHLRSELMLTSSASREGEYFRYGSEIDKATLQPIRAWSSYSWRGESKAKSEEIEKRGVLDVAAGIFAIRRDPPEKSRRMEIWSDGKIYPVVVIPRGAETRKLSDRSIKTRHYQIRGVEVPGRRKWKGKLDLWLAMDQAATPVEITISRNLADVRMELKSHP
jgi:hypothetical protein